MLEDLLKISQICFYAGTLLLGFRTYIYAKKNIMNTVHLEYQKKVINRLEQIATKLTCEFDKDNDMYWVKMFRFEKQLSYVDDIFEENKDKIIESGEFKDRGFFPSHPLCDDYLQSVLLQIKSDPFVPKQIREVLINFLENRINIFRNAYFTNYEKYQDKLAKGQLEQYDVKYRHGIFHNWMMDSLNEQRCGIADTEKEINSIRFKIQEYFENYNPIK